MKKSNFIREVPAFMPIREKLKCDKCKEKKCQEAICSRFNCHKFQRQFSLVLFSIEIGALLFGKKYVNEHFKAFEEIFTNKFDKIQTIIFLILSFLIIIMIFDIIVEKCCEKIFTTLETIRKWHYDCKVKKIKEKNSELKNKESKQKDNALAVFKELKKYSDNLEEKEIKELFNSFIDKLSEMNSLELFKDYLYTIYLPQLVENTRFYVTLQNEGKLTEENKEQFKKLLQAFLKNVSSNNVPEKNFNLEATALRVSLDNLEERK